MMRFLHVALLCSFSLLADASCGEACSYNSRVSNLKGWFEVDKRYNCTYLLDGLRRSMPSNVWPPPRSPPSHLWDLFTQFGDMPITKEAYYAQKYSGSNAQGHDWTQDYIEQLRLKARKGEAISGYGVPGDKDVLAAIRRSPFSLERAHALVVGSETPWVESLLLNTGVSTVTTLEYGTINSTHPQVSTYIPSQLGGLFLQGELPKFDLVVSYSSIEHSGLGRYGDMLNPFGDFEAAAQMWCLLRPGGLLFLNVPFNGEETGYIEFNAHRVYGWTRIRHLLANFALVERIEGYPPYHGMFIARKRA
jgi:hypothetical protein